MPYRIVSLCIRFESYYAGVSRPGARWKEISNTCHALVMVEVPPVPGACIPCEANPCGFICHCKGGRKTGICYHILLVTHLVFRKQPLQERLPKYNLHYMMGKIAGAKKGSHRPKRVKHCLQKESSSDEDEDDPRLEGEGEQPRRLKW